MICNLWYTIISMGSDAQKKSIQSKHYRLFFLGCILIILYTLRIPFFKNSSSKSFIPRVIYQTWIDKNIHEANLNALMNANKGFEHVLLTHENCSTFLNDYYPHAGRIFDKINPQVRKSIDHVKTFTNLSLEQWKAMSVDMEFYTSMGGFSN